MEPRQLIAMRCTNHKRADASKSGSLRISVSHHVNYNQYFLCNFVGMGPRLGTISGTILDYRRDPYVQCKGPLKVVDIDSTHVGFRV